VHVWQPVLRQLTRPRTPSRTGRRSVDGALLGPNANESYRPDRLLGVCTYAFEDKTDNSPDRVVIIRLLPGNGVVMVMTDGYTVVGLLMAIIYADRTSHRILFGYLSRERCTLKRPARRPIYLMISFPSSSNTATDIQTSEMLNKAGLI